MSQTDLSALIGSRICHDLISPLGAIGNGLELLQMSGVGDSPEMTLIRDAVASANARVRLFRIAFGAASTEQRVSWGEVSQAIDGFDGRRLRIDWPPTTDLSRAEVRLILLLLMSAEAMMPHGGSVRVMAKPMAVMMTAERFRTEPEFLGPLMDASLAPEASDVHFACAREAAQTLGLTIKITQGSGTLALAAI